MTQPIWVDHPDTLDAMVEDLSRVNIFAIDTESNSLHAYQEQVCLIQISTATQDYLVDPLILTDLAVLGPLFADPAKEKIFHAAEYDLICLKRDFGFRFSNLFDTMIAARILGRSGIGLGSMLQAEFGIELDKHFQRADWGRRPLTPPMLNYARLDSHYLISLRNRMLTALQEADRWEMAVEDFARMCGVEASIPDEERDPFWRIAGGRTLNPQQAAVLQELHIYRDMLAQRMDLPPFKVLSNHILLDVAVNCPRTREQLSQSCGLRGRLLERFGGGLLQSVQRGLKNNKPPQRPPSQRPDDRVMDRTDRLRSWRKQTGLNMGVESDVVLPRDIMEAIAENGPEDLDTLAKIMESTPYRYRQFGAQILTILSGRKK